MSHTSANYRFVRTSRPMGCSQATAAALRAGHSFEYLGRGTAYIFHRAHVVSGHRTSFCDFAGSESRKLVDCAIRAVRLRVGGHGGVGSKRRIARFL